MLIIRAGDSGRAEPGSASSVVSNGSRGTVARLPSTAQHSKLETLLQFFVHYFLFQVLKYRLRFTRVKLSMHDALHTYYISAVKTSDIKAS